MNEYKGSLDASGKRFAIVAGRFNESFTANLVNGAVDSLQRLGAEEEHVDLYWVPGSFEVPHAAHAAAASGQYDAVIALGVLGALLAQVAGCELVEVAGHDTCCGFGGTFSVKQPELSVAMADAKLEAIEASGVDAVVSGDVSCLMQLGGRHRADVLH